MSGQLYHILSVVCEVDGETEKQDFSTSQKAIIQAFRDMTNESMAQLNSASPLPPAEAAC